MRKKFIGLLFLLMFVNSTYAAMLVNKAVVNMYKTPDTNASVVSQATYGAKVNIIAPKVTSSCENNTKNYYGWYCIQTPDHYFGWVESATLRNNPSYYKSIERNPNSFLTTTNVKTYLYQDNSTSSHQPIMALPFDTKLRILAQPEKDNKRWIKVKLINGFSAWIQRGMIHVGNYHLSMHNMLKITPKFIGLPYTWGGSSSFGFDCSGFTQAMYKIVGIKLLRDSGLQANQINAVTVLTPKQLQQDQFNRLHPGDLLFFGHHGHITHVGLYLGIYGKKHYQFIDSSVDDDQGENDPVLAVNDLSAKFWRSLFVVAKHYSVT